MSLPNIPNITPIISLDRCESINLLLSSIALEEISLSHILNAEGEKLQYFLKSCPKYVGDYLKLNDSVNKTLRTIVKSQLLLEMKLEEVVELDKDSCCTDKHCYDCSGRRKHSHDREKEGHRPYHSCGDENCEHCHKKHCPICNKPNCKGCEKPYPC